MPILKHHAVYARCSTDEQAEGEFTTLDAQKAIAALPKGRRWLKRKRGGKALIAVSDAAKSRGTASGQADPAKTKLPATPAQG